MVSTNWAGALVVSCLLAGSAWGQYVISAKAGLIHYTEGQVFLGEAINSKPGEYPEMKPGQHLTTKQGRAEVLLSPGVFMRLAENSDVAMISNSLTDTRVEIVSGSVIIEAAEILKEHSIEIAVAGVPIELRKSGVFRIDAGSPPLVRVYDGELSVLYASGPVRVKEGRQMLLTSVPAVEKFPKDDSDSFLRWAGRRSGQMAVSNIRAANMLRVNGGSWTGGGWYFDPLMGMYSYIPLNGRYNNYWGYSYYSPRTVFEQPQMRPPQYASPDGFSAMSNSARGMSDMSGRSYSGGGSSSAVYQAPATASAPPAAVSSGDGRGASSGGSRGGSGGAR